jgi:hypothetical protein
VRAGGFNIAAEPGDGAGLKQQVGLVGSERQGLADILLGAAELLLPHSQRRGQIPGEGIGWNELQPLVDIGAGAGEIAGSDQGAGAVEMYLPPQFGRERGYRKRRIECAAGLGGVARRKPGIAGLHPIIRPACILGGLRLECRLLERRCRGRPPFQLRISEAEALASIKAASGAAPARRHLDRFLRIGFGQSRAAFARGLRRLGNGKGQQERDHNASRSAATVRMRSAMSDSRDSRWSPSLIRIVCTSDERSRSASCSESCQGTSSSAWPCSRRTGRPISIGASSRRRFSPDSQKVRVVM